MSGVVSVKRDFPCQGAPRWTHRSTSFSIESYPKSSKSNQIDNNKKCMIVEAAENALLNKRGWFLYKRVVVVRKGRFCTKKTFLYKRKLLYKRAVVVQKVSLFVLTVNFCTKGQFFVAKALLCTKGLCFYTKVFFDCTKAAFC